MRRSRLLALAAPAVMAAATPADCAEPLPDLQVVAVGVAETGPSLHLGTCNTVEARLSNLSMVPVTIVFNVRLRIETPAGQTDYEQEVRGLPAHGQATVRFEAVVVPMGPSALLAVTADIAGALPELDEANNRLQVGAEVGGACDSDSQPDAPIAPPGRGSTVVPPPG